MEGSLGGYGAPFDGRRGSGVIIIPLTSSDPGEASTTRATRAERAAPFKPPLAPQKWAFSFLRQSGGGRRKRAGQITEGEVPGVRQRSSDSENKVVIFCALIKSPSADHEADLKAEKHGLLEERQKEKKNLD